MSTSSDLAYHLVQAGAGSGRQGTCIRPGPRRRPVSRRRRRWRCSPRRPNSPDPGPRRAALRARGELLLGLFRGREAAADLEIAMREAAEQDATAEEMEALLRLGRAYYVVGLDHRPAIAQSLKALERARQLAVQLGDRHAEARALIPTHRHVDFDPAFRPQAAANANRALAIARELSDEDLEVDALRAAHRMGTVTARREGIERIAAALERRGDLIALNEHLFDAMWTYWRAGRFTDCVALLRSSDGAGRPARHPARPVRHHQVVRPGRSRPLRRGLAGARTGSGGRRASVRPGIPASGANLVVRGRRRLRACHSRCAAVFADAKALQRTWMIPWAEDLLASAIVASHPEGTERGDAPSGSRGRGGTPHGRWTCCRAAPRRRR